MHVKSDAKIHKEKVNLLKGFLATVQPERAGSILTGIYPLKPQQRIDIWRQKMATRESVTNEINQ